MECQSRASSSRLACLCQWGFEALGSPDGGETISAVLQQHGSVWSFGAQHPTHPLTVMQLAEQLLSSVEKLDAAVAFHAPIMPACRAYKQAVRSVQEDTQTLGARDALQDWRRRLGHRHKQCVHRQELTTNRGFAAMCWAAAGISEFVCSCLCPSCRHIFLTLMILGAPIGPLVPLEI